MAISQITTVLTTLPDAPQRTDPTNFSTKADAFVEALSGDPLDPNDGFDYELQQIVSEINTVATEMNSTATTTQALSNYQGAWTATGYTAGQSVSYGGVVYVAESNTAAGNIPGAGLPWASTGIPSGITSSAAELNKLTGVTTTATQFNYLNTLTSNVQSQIAGKANSSHTHLSANITDATNTNVGNSIVKRDGNGDFTARIITATTFTGALSGNASTATSASSASTATTATSAGKWTTARTLSYIGAITGSGNVDGSGNVQFTTSFATTQIDRNGGTIDGGNLVLSANRSLYFSDDSAMYSNGTNIIWNFVADGDLYLRDVNSNAYRFLFDTSAGNFHARNDIIAVSATLTSDAKLKENITKITNSIEKVNMLNGVEFNWIKDGKLSAGVIAQDVQKVLPQAVTEVSSLEDEGETHLTVNYNCIIGLLIEAVKEQQLQIEELKSKV